MANGNDWENPSNQGSEQSDFELNEKQPGQQQPPGGGGNGGNRGGGGSDDNMGIGDGWGEGDASIDEVVENVKRVFQAFKGEVMFAWLALAGVALIFALLETGLALMSALMPDLGVFSILQIPVSFLGGLVGVGIVAVQFSLYRPLKRKVFESFDPGDWQTALKSNLSPVLWILLTILVLGFGTSIGTVCCIVPGLFVAFLGSMAPYLMATRPNIDMMDAFKTSYVLAKKYWQIFAITIGALIGAGLVAGCFLGIASVLVSVLGSFGAVLSPGLGWIGTTLFQLGVFIVWGGVFMTVDEKEGTTR